MSHRRRRALRGRQATLGTVLLSALIVGGIPAAGHAEPTPKITAIPDAGLRPVPSGLPTLPTGLLSTPKALPSSGLARIEAQIAAVSAETRILEARLAELSRQRTEAVTAQATADLVWRNAKDALAAAEAEARQAAAEAYQAAAVLPPNMTYDKRLQALDALLPHNDDLPSVREAAARELVRARQAEQEAFATFGQAGETVRRLESEHRTLDQQYRQRVKALDVLNARRAVLLTEQDRTRERANQRIGSGWDTGQKADNLIAHPKARKAVKFALSQLGKPYLWGAEGPDKYDCSGLVLTSYLKAGVRLNRIANDQYEGTKSRPVTVSRSYLLPGDLLFFATNRSNPRSIHHVGMYIGNGKMVHSPNSRSTVRVDDVNFAAVDFATRVVKALPVPTSSPTPSPTPSTPPSAPPSASPSASPSPSTSPSTSPSPMPSPTPSTSPPTSPSPTPSTSPPTSPSPTPKVSKSISPSPKASASLADSSSPNGTGSPSAPASTSAAVAGSPSSTPVP